MARYDYAQAACPLIDKLAEACKQEFPINPELYTKYDVKRGLRDLNGKGVLAGLTNIGNVCASKMVDGQSVPCDGKLYYRGIDVEDLVAGFAADDRPGFEETTYLLLFGQLPDKKGACGFYRTARRPAVSSGDLHPRCHHEGPQRQYDEHSCKVRSGAVFLRQCGK